MSTTTRKFYVGSYSEADTEGIHILELDSEGRMRKTGGMSGIRNPSFLDIAPSGAWLAAVSESGDGKQRGEGSVTIYRIDARSGDLGLVGTSPTGGPGLCHVAVSPDEKCVVAASYSGGNIVVIPLSSAAAPGERTAFIQHEGSGPNQKRQEKAHAHSVTFSPDGTYLYACDLGIDRIMIYRCNTETGIVTAADPPFAEANPGAGPRHFTFSPVADYAYCINELDNTITAYAYRRTDGRLQAIETYSTLPDSFSGSNTCADIHFHPSGRRLYGSNRGHDSIAVFEADPDSGKLKAVGHCPSGGKTPRNFGITPDGTMLLAANQDSDNIVSYMLDQETGTPTPTGNQIRVPKPVCVRFL